MNAHARKTIEDIRRGDDDHARRIRTSAADDTAGDASASSTESGADSHADSTDRESTDGRAATGRARTADIAGEPRSTSADVAVDLAPSGPMGLSSRDEEEPMTRKTSPGKRKRARPKPGTDAAQLAAAKSDAPRPRGRPRTPRPVDMRRKPENLDDAQLLERAIRASGDMTDAEFAERVAFVNPRTLRKYRAGRPLNRLLREKLVGYIAERTA